MSGQREEPPNAKKPKFELGSENVEDLAKYSSPYGWGPTQAAAGGGGAAQIHATPDMQEEDPLMVVNSTEATPSRDRSPGPTAAGGGAAGEGGGTREGPREPATIMVGFDTDSSSESEESEGEGNAQPAAQQDGGNFQPADGEELALRRRPVMHVQDDSDSDSDEPADEIAGPSQLAN